MQKCTTLLKIITKEVLLPASLYGILKIRVRMKSSELMESVHSSDYMKMKIQVYSQSSPVSVQVKINVRIKQCCPSMHLCISACVIKTHNHKLSSSININFHNQTFFNNQCSSSINFHCQSTLSLHFVNQLSQFLHYLSINFLYL